MEKFRFVCLRLGLPSKAKSLLHGQESCAKEARRTLKGEGQAVGQKSLDREWQRGPFLSVILITRYDHPRWKSEYPGSELSNEQKHVSDIGDRLLLSEKGSRGSLAQSKSFTHCFRPCVEPTFFGRELPISLERVTRRNGGQEKRKKEVGKEGGRPEERRARMGRQRAEWAWRA